MQRQQRQRPRRWWTAALLGSIACIALGMGPALLAPTVFGQAHTASAIFAGGCFWCMEPPYDELDGVIATTSGYTGGTVADPTYEQVSAATTGHYEAVRVTYDPSVISYETLLDVFWRNIDPLDGGGQFCDRGPQYRSAVFYANDEQERLARASKRDLEHGDARLEGSIETEILAASTFYAAEEYHQDYYQKNPLRYRFYRYSCGRDARLEEVWGEAPH